MRLIDADALKNYMAEKYVMYDHTFDDIDAQPTIEPKNGKWIWDDEGYHCSECFYHAYGETGSILSNEWHYCPNCGAKMERSEE